MPFIPATDGYRAAVTYENTAGNQAVNVFWFRDAGGGDETTRAGVLTSIMADWLQTHWASVANIDWTAVNAEARGWSQEVAGYDVQPLDIPGTLTGEPLPSEVTIAISHRTGLTGRSMRGRTYHVGIGESNTTGDYISDGYRINLINAYAALISMAMVFDFTWVVASFVTNGAPRVGAVLTPITQVVIVDTIVDSMRKRKPRAT